MKFSNMVVSRPPARRPPEGACVANIGAVIWEKDGFL